MGRRANGEGSIYATIQKIKRKKFDTRGEWIYVKFLDTFFENFFYLC